MKKKVGRPTERAQDRQLQMRVDDEFIAAIDDWRRQQPDIPNRTQAVRRLVDLGLRGGLAHMPAKRRRSEPSEQTTEELDVLDFAEFALRIKNIDLKGVKPTPQLMKSVRDTIEAWTKVKDGLAPPKRRGK